MAGDSITQKDINARAIAARDLYYNERKPTAMGALIEKYKAEVDANPELKAVIAVLNHYLEGASHSSVMGLAEKLKAGYREDELEEAEDLKEYAFKRIMEHTFSEAAQKIFALTLGEICECFRYKVSPLIKQNSSRAQVDAAVKDHVIDSVLAFLEENVLEIYHRDLRALLYFLTGNCHINWH